MSNVENGQHPITHPRGGSRSLSVVHFGPQGDVPGGMAQVINGYLVWKFEATTVTGVRTTFGRRQLKRDIPRYLACLAQLVRTRATTQSLCVFHMSQRGSFIREGSLVAFASFIGLKTAIHMHGSEFVEHAERYPSSTAWIFSRARAVFTLTDAATATAKRLLCGRPHVRVVKLTNAVQLPEVRDPGSKQNRIVMAGELGHRKGVDIILEAWNKLGDLTVNWELELVGPRSETVRDWPALPRLRYIGVEPHDKLLTRLVNSRIAVLPARHEAMPMFLLEAMAAGCAIIATSVGQVPQIVDSTNGILIPKEDAAALASAIAYLIENPRDLNSKADQSIDRIKRAYSAEAMVKMLEFTWVSIIEDDFEGSSRG